MPCTTYCKCDRLVESCMNPYAISEDQQDEENEEDDLVDGNEAEAENDLHE